MEVLMNQGNIVVMQNGEVQRMDSACADQDGWHEHYLGGAVCAAFLFD